MWRWCGKCCLPCGCFTVSGDYVSCTEAQQRCVNGESLRLNGFWCTSCSVYPVPDWSSRNVSCFVFLASTHRYWTAGVTRVDPREAVWRHIGGCLVWIRCTCVLTGAASQSTGFGIKCATGVFWINGVLDLGVIRIVLDGQAMVALNVHRWRVWH